MRTEPTFEKIKELGTISEKGQYTKECNVIVWNGGEKSIDIRGWKLTNEVGKELPLKGISLSFDEAIHLRDILNACDLEGMKNDSKK